MEIKTLIKLTPIFLNVQFTPFTAKTFSMKILKYKNEKYWK